LRTFGFFRRERGQSLVELALALPLLVFGLIGAGDLARAYAIQSAVENGARAGAEAYAIKAVPAGGILSRTQQEMTGTPGMQAGAATISTSFPTISGVSYVTVRVQYTFRTTVPWPLVPNTVTFDRSTTLRVYS
jgi:Flp pilus assembly protein TadG